jgi:assimilatory nitrate reductase catalytic subunit
MVGTEVIWVAGSNVAECSPITTNYIWQAREHGRQSHRPGSAHHTPRTNVRSVPPVKPGRDAALFAGVLQPDDRARLDRSRLHRAAHHGFDEVAAYCRQWTPARTADVTGVPERSIRQAAELGHGEEQLPVSRTRHRAPFQRRAERARHDQSGPRVGTHR